MAENSQDSNGIKANGATKEHQEQKTFYWQQYFTALRPWSFSASLTPVILGSVLSWKETGNFSFILAILVLIAIISVHGAGNLVNTYYDFLSGIDSHESDDKTLVNKILRPEEVVRFGVILYLIGCVSFLAILVVSPSRIDHLAFLFFAGLSGSFFYTG